MSIVIAKFFGLYFLSVGLAFLLNPKRLGEIYQIMQKNEAVAFLGGIIALVIGAFVVSIHNVWVMGWPVVITILGWWSLIKGFGMLVYSNFINLFSFMFQRSDLVYRAIGFIIFLFGLFFSFQGWQ
jgi:hypothetical protein